VALLTLVAAGLCTVTPVASAQDTAAEEPLDAPADVDDATEGAARTAEVDNAAETEARALFHAGRSAYGAGRYDAAVEYFQRAYGLSGHPELLFNVGSAAERARRDTLSIESYRAYLEARPDAENRAFVEGRIRFLEQRVLEPRDVDQSEPDRSSDGGVASTWWFWTIIGALALGGAVAITAAVLVGPGTEPPLPGNVGVSTTLVEF
jgi:tetratricopeptide (TPR) repeat protein